jgi:GNAT superfamily N-acetyltransferase
MTEAPTSAQAPQVTIRPATAMDLTEILRHRRLMFEEMGYNNAKALQAMEDCSEPFIHRGLIEGSYHGWIAESAGRFAGGVGVITTPWPAHPRDPHPTKAYILNMYVYPPFRRHGVARRLMELALAWCREQGYGTVSLHASEHGRHLYESLGFQPTNEMRLIFKG